jgi:long-chain acyl-CoA synthetase
MSSEPSPKPWPALSVAQAHALLTAQGAPFEMEERVIRGIPTRVWKNIPPTIRELFLAGRAHGEKIFLVHEQERVSYDAFARAALGIAAALIQDGVKKGDRVALIMRNLPEWPAAFFGITLTGAIVTPLNAWWTGPELEYGLTDSGAKVAIVDAERLERLSEHLHNCPDLVRVLVSRENEEVAHPLVRKLEELIGPPDAWRDLPEGALPDVPLDPEDDITIFYTSGTTGKPKGALGTHRNLLSNIGAAGFSGARSFLRRGEQPPAPDPTAPQRSMLLAIPFFHATGCHAILCPTVAAGGKIVAIRKWDAEAAMKLIEQEKITGTGGVPTIAWQLIEHPARAKYNLSSLESVTYGGAPSAPELVRKIKETFPLSQPGNGWGMTETSATVTSHLGEDTRTGPTAAARPARSATSR